MLLTTFVTGSEKTCLIYMQILTNFQSLKLNNFSLNMVLISGKFLPLVYALITGGSAETYRIVIAYPEKKMYTIKHYSVFCVDKAGFLRLAYNW